MFWFRRHKHAGRIAMVAGAALLAGVALLALTSCGEPRDCSTPESGCDADRPASEPVARDIAAGDLHGEFLSPSPGAPVVLIVPGSGPTDRNGNSAAGISASTYRLLAEELAKHNIASVRVDKRGMFTSAGAGDPNAVSVEAYAEDYRGWIDAIRAETGRPCVFLLGHSEGALMVSAAAQGRSDVCGLILAAGPGRKLGVILREQLQANPANAPILPQALEAIALLEAGESVDIADMHPALQGLFAPQVQPFLISLLRADPAALAASAGAPVLILQGSTDIQVTQADADALAEATGGERVVLEGVNHVLKLTPADRNANLAAYSDASLPLAPGVADAVAAFVKTYEAR